jgi:hypothetical protein
MIYVPVSALASPDEGTPPKVGDEVPIQVVGRVKSIEGDTACVDIIEANGSDVAEKKQEAEPTEESLRAEAERIDAY